MKTFLVIFFCAFLIFETQSQITHNLVTLTNLDNTLDETSGLIFFNGGLWTHNDSGGDHKIYQIDTLNGQVSRTITISNISNTDWEDIAQDNDYVYIGDFGNNLGNRTDLAIYKISKSHIDTVSNDTVMADTINFSFSDQTDFTPAQYTTNYDCEAFICIDDTLVLFTKMWGAQWTKSYRLPNVAGTHVALLTDSFNVGGLITGADIDPINGSVCLLGYTFGLPSSSFVWCYSGFSGTNVFSGNSEKIEFNLENIQVEGISNITAGKYIISSEKGSQSSAKLYSFPLDNILFYEKVEKKYTKQLMCHPNPSSGIIRFHTAQTGLLEMYDSGGNLVYRKNCKDERVINVSTLDKACYLLRFVNKDFVYSDKIILN